MASQAPSQKHLAYRDAILAAMRAHAGDLPADEILAITAHLVGQLIAMQDQRRFTPDLVMKIVSNNIEQGNREVVDGLLTKTEGRA